MAVPKRPSLWIGRGLTRAEGDQINSPVIVRWRLSPPRRAQALLHLPVLMSNLTLPSVRRRIRKS